MAWSITDLFPSWGDTGEKPPSGKDYQGGDNVNEKHFDYLWYAVGELEKETRSALADIDNDKDGIVDEANNAHEAESGEVDAGDLGSFYVQGLADGETIEILHARLTQTDGSAVPSGVDLVLATNAASKTTVLSGDGTTIYDDESGSPLASYTNSTGSAETILVAVDNGHYNAGSGSKQAVLSSVVYRVV